MIGEDVFQNMLKDLRDDWQDGDATVVSLAIGIMNPSRNLLGTNECTSMQLKMLVRQVSNERGAF